MKYWEHIIQQEYGYQHHDDDIVERTLSLLHNDGINIGKAFCDLPIGARLVLLAEAVNWAAKVIDDSYYNLKPAIVARAAQEWGVRAWYNPQEGTWSLYHKEVGVASFHDPNDEILIESDDTADWNFPWSGVRRQDLAFEMLTDEGLLATMANITRPRRFPLSTMPSLP